MAHPIKERPSTSARKIADANTSGAAFGSDLPRAPAECHGAAGDGCTVGHLRVTSDVFKLGGPAEP